MYDKDISKWNEYDGYFVETHSYPAILEQVRKQAYVVFVGVQGSGKTATIRHIALLLQKEGYEIVILRDIRFIETYCNPNKPQVFVIDDVIGKSKLDESELNTLSKYEDRITKPVMPKSKTLMACREIVFRNKSLSNHFVSEKENAVKLHSALHVLTDEDKRAILAKHNLGNITSFINLPQTSKMFPLLCNLFSNEIKFKECGPLFFCSPILCILEDLNNLKTKNAIQYASLVLLVFNQNKLKKNYLETDTYSKSMKTKLLTQCKVKSTTDSFEFGDALIEMEGTYTLEFDNYFTFVNDYMFKITAYHFGQECQELILEYMSSDYIANYTKVVKPDRYHTIKKRHETNREKTWKNKQSMMTAEKENITDLCITLQESNFPILADRLFRDIRNGELDTVFGNHALKQRYVLQKFIVIMKKASYRKLCIVFLSDLNESLSPHCNNRRTPQRFSNNDDYHIQRLLTNEVCGQSRQRAVSWMIYHGHPQLLTVLIDTIIKVKGDVDDLFKPFSIRGQTRVSDLNETDKHATFPNEQRSVFHTKSQHSVTFNPFHYLHSLLTCCLPFKDKRDNETNISKYHNKTLIAKSKDKTEHTIYNTMKWTKTASDNWNEATIQEQWCLLCLSCHSGNLQTVQLVLKHVSKAAINNQTSYIDYFINSPLAIACECGHLEIVRELINAGADINLKSGFHTPLTVACEKGDLSVVETLLKLKADVNLGTYFHNPLTVSCEKGYLCIVKKLLKKGANINVRTNLHSPLSIAIEKGHTGIVELLLKKGAQLHTDFQSDTKTAAMLSGQLNIRKKLISTNFDCQFGHLDSVEDSKKPGSDIYAENHLNRSLEKACYEGDLNTVKLLLKKGADVNAVHNGNTPMIVACERGHLEIVKTFIEAKADVNHKNKTKTPLTAACYGGQSDIVEELIKAGANVNQQDNIYVPVIVACKMERWSIAEKLIKAGARYSVVSFI